MAASKSDIRFWIDNRANRGYANATHMLVFCDTFDYDDYPVYVTPDEDVRKVIAEKDGKNMQQLMECYNLGENIEEQLLSNRVMNL
jgi:restriction endonuclease Mrr